MPISPCRLGFLIDCKAEPSDARNVAFNKEQAVATATTNPCSHPKCRLPFKLIKKSQRKITKRMASFHVSLFQTLRKMDKLNMTQEIWPDWYRGS